MTRAPTAAMLAADRVSRARALADDGTTPAAPAAAPTLLTRERFIEAYRVALAARHRGVPGFGADSIGSIVGCLVSTLNGHADAWSMRGYGDRAIVAWKAIGGAGTLTMRKLRELPVAASAPVYCACPDGGEFTINLDTCALCQRRRPTPTAAAPVAPNLRQLVAFELSVGAMPRSMRCNVYIPSQVGVGLGRSIVYRLAAAVEAVVPVAWVVNVEIAGLADTEILGVRGTVTVMAVVTDGNPRVAARKLLDRAIAVVFAELGSAPGAVG